MVMVDSCVIHLAALLHDPTLSYAMLHLALGETGRVSDNICVQLITKVGCLHLRAGRELFWRLHIK
ncbi:hypothetical protein M3J09_010734 [Ascochyta lentis]